ncbi:MAG: ATPase P [Anaerolineales bacterium]|nr:ATPase P [Anaerolineales bacterium]
MIELNIPGRGVIRLDHLVSDVNGTLALDGNLIPGVVSAILRLSDRLTLHLLTADTHGRQDLIDQQLGIQAVRIPEGEEALAKADYVRQLGPERVVALGQGANDSGMLSEAVIGICILSKEGASIETLQAADIAVPDIETALDLIENPMRLVATLRQ